MIRDAEEDVEDAKDDASKLRLQGTLDSLKATAAAIEADGRTAH
jgi:F-type H+-transporting ATPase subunit epsilon